MNDILTVLLTLSILGIFAYGISYFIGKVGNDDEQD
jgi:hypothetical protein